MCTRLSILSIGAVVSLSQDPDVDKGLARDVLVTSRSP